MSVTSVDISANSFKGVSGKEYLIFQTLSTKRFEVFERLQVDLEYGSSMSAFRKEISAAYDMFNQMKFADGCTKLNNSLNGLSRIEGKQPHPVLLICALFVCSKDEDQGQWSDTEAQAKVEDWASIDVAFFLKLARHFLSHFMSGSSLDTLNTLESKQAGEAGPL